MDIDNQKTSEITEAQLAEQLYKTFEVALIDARVMRDDLIKVGRNLMGGVAWNEMADKPIDSGVRFECVRTEVARMVLVIHEQGVNQVVEAYEDFKRSMCFIKHGMNLTNGELVQKVQVMEQFIARVYSVHLHQLAEGQPVEFKRQIKTDNVIWN